MAEGLAVDRLAALALAADKLGALALAAGTASAAVAAIFYYLRKAFFKRRMAVEVRLGKRL